MAREFTDQEMARRVKLERLVELGVDPYGQKYEDVVNSVL